MPRNWSILHDLGGLVLLALGIASGLSSLFTLLLLINSVNPFQTVTIRSVEVVNDSGRDLEITPVGTMGRGYIGPENLGEKRVLSQFLLAFPAIPSILLKDLSLENGGARVINYDDEVLHFTDLLLCDRTGKWSRMEVARYENHRWRLLSTNNAVVIDPSSLALPIEAQAMEAVHTSRRVDWMISWILVAPVVFLTCSGLLLFRLRTTPAKVSPRGSLRAA